MTFNDIYEEAHRAGLKALTECKPIPIRVVEHANMLDDASPIIKDWGLIDGVCGYAWINVKPGTSRFARWLKENKKADTDTYYGGVTIWVRYGGQSLERKEAYAEAFADSLIKRGFHAINMSRID